MASSARIDELKKKFDENPRRYFAPLANEFRKMGEIEQAIMICEEFLPQQAGHMSGHIVYGQALYEAGRLPESRTVFETALTLDPENLIALRHLGDIAKGNGELEPARHWYTRVLDADPRNEEIQGLLYALDDTPAIVLDESTLSLPNATAATISSAPPPPSSRDEQRFAPPPTALPQLPKTAAPPPPPPRPTPPAPAPLDLELDDALSMEVLKTASPVSRAATDPGTSFGDISLAGLEPTSTGELRSSGPQPADGLESSEFVPPLAAAGGGGVGSMVLENFEPGEFTAPTTSIAPLAGLEDMSVGGSALSAFTEPSALPPLDVDDGMTLSFQGDAVVPGAPAAPARPTSPPAPASSRDEFSVPNASAGYRKPPVTHSAPTDWRGMPDLDEPDEAGAGEPSAVIPSELPPAVIAAEAELIYLVAPDEVTTEASSEASEPSTGAPARFVTETMAELFVKQGFREQARDVYRQLLAASPGDERLRAKVAELQPAPPAYSGPTVREFFARLAMLRPGARSAAGAPPSADDFASFDAVPAVPEPSWSPSPPPPPPPPPQPEAQEPARARATPAMTSAVERAASTQSRPSGSIDALFGNRAVGTSEDSAASALAQAFGGGDQEAPSISGRPARAAAKELSLDSVFRDGGARAPRPSGSFSFDQFFSEKANGGGEKPTAPTTGSHDVVAPTEPAERSADDISQFNSWLQGLKHR